MKYTKQFVLTLAITLIIATTPLATVINVPTDETTIQAALDIAGQNDTVLVAPGTYYENITFPGLDIVLASQYIYSTDSTDITGTIIDGSHLTAGDSLGSVIRIVSGETIDTKVIGLTIQYGIGEFSGSYASAYGRRGGGILVENASATIANNVIRFNSVSGNYTKGAGISLSNGVANIYYNVVRNNSMDGYNYEYGAIFVDECGGTIVRGNVITGNGYSGVHMFYSALVDSNIIIDNGGPGIWTQATADINHNFIANNAEDGIYANYSILNLTKNVIVQNAGCGLVSRATHFDITNCTVADNTSWGLHKFWHNVTTIRIRNSIFWGNNSHSEQIYLEESADAEIWYSDIADGPVGVIVGGGSTLTWFDGNFNLDPLFFDPSELDYSLAVTSPCIDAGNPDPYYNDPDGTRNDVGAIPSDLGTDVDDNEPIPHQYSLSQNYPNPFNPTTMIEFALARRSAVKLSIYNILGQQVRCLLDTELSAGTHEVQWNGCDESGNEVATGIYLYTLRTADFSVSKKMLLVK